MALHPNPAWRELIRLSFRQAFAYRAGIPMVALFVGVQLFVTRTVWETVYQGRDSVDGVNAQTLLVYLSVSSLQSWMFSGIIAWNIQQRVETGRVAFDLMRPFGFLRQMLAMHTGTSLASAVFVVAYIPLVLWIGALTPPTLPNLAMYFVSLILAMGVNTLIWLHVGMITFWLMQVNGIRVLLQIVNSFLAGALIPLWLMPDGLRVAMSLLPFQATNFLPASIYSGQVTGVDTLVPIGQQLAWLVLLSFTARLMWARAQHKIVVQGG